MISSENALNVCIFNRSFGVNNFSGTLPPELGNLVNLEEL
jgi:hypothetical protein